MPHEILFSLLDETQNTKNGKKGNLKKKKEKQGALFYCFKDFIIS